MWSHLRPLLNGINCGSALWVGLIFLGEPKSNTSTSMSAACGLLSQACIVWTKEKRWQFFPRVESQGFPSEFCLLFLSEAYLKFSSYFYFTCNVFRQNQWSVRPLCHWGMHHLQGRWVTAQLVSECLPVSSPCFLHPMGSMVLVHFACEEPDSPSQPQSLASCLAES